MSKYLGDFATGQTVHCYFSTSAAAGSRVAFSDALEAGDIRVYKNGSTTERSSTSGFTVTSAFDSLVGGHYAGIDLSDNTDAGFYAAGNDYAIWLYPDTETVDSLAVAACIGQFSIENRSTSLARRSGLKLSGTAQGGTTTSITLPSTASATDDYYVGDFILCEIDGLVDGQFCTDYNGTTKVATTDAWKGGIAPDSNDLCEVFAGGTGTLTSTLAAAVFSYAHGSALGSLTHEQLLTKLAARLLGNNSGLTAGAGTLVDKDLSGTNAVSQVVSTDGNRSSLNLAP